MTGQISIHGGLVNVFDMGVLILGQPASGKSQLALNLLDRGHYFIADDITLLEQHNGVLFGRCKQGFEGRMAIRDIGFLNLLSTLPYQIANQSTIDLVIQLVRCAQKQHNTLGKSRDINLLDKHILPEYVLQVEGQRPLALLVEWLVTKCDHAYA